MGHFRRKLFYSVVVVGIVIAVFGCSGGGSDRSTPLPVDVIGLQGESYVWRGGVADIVAIEETLRSVEQALGYAGTSLAMLRVITEPFEINENGQPYIDCVKALAPDRPARPRCHGYFNPQPPTIGFHLGFGLAGSALRFEANRFFKWMHGSPDWNCVEYDKPSPNCFDNYK